MKINRGKNDEKVDDNWTPGKTRRIRTTTKVEMHEPRLVKKMIQ